MIIVNVIDTKPAEALPGMHKYLKETSDDPRQSEVIRSVSVDPSHPGELATTLWENYDVAILPMLVLAKTGRLRNVIDDFLESDRVSVEERIQTRLTLNRLVRKYNLEPVWPEFSSSNQNNEGAIQRPKT